MWGLLTPVLMAILIIWLMTRWVRIDEYVHSVRERISERFARPEAVAPSEPPVSAEDLELRERYKAWRDEVLALPDAEARARAEVALADSRCWRCTPAEARDYPYSGLLAPSLRTFLRAWAEIEDAYGGVRISREELALYTWPDIASLSFATQREAEEGRSVRLGVDRDGDPIVVRQGREPVTVVHGGRPGSREVWFSEYPSLYHFLLLQHSEPEASVGVAEVESARRLIDGPD